MASPASSRALAALVLLTATTPAPAWAAPSKTPGKADAPRVRVPVVVPKGYGPTPAERGVALGLFSKEPSYRYRMLVDEVVATGATHLSVVWVWWQDDVRATEIRAVPERSATDEQVKDTLQYAKQAGLHVTAFPIVRLLRSTRAEWRGKIAPTSEDEWWASYDAYILHNAQLAASAGADRFCVGSELLTRERMRARWQSLIDRLRLDTPSLELLYSANWDHFQPVSFWDLVDVVGMTGYWELTKDNDATVTDLLRAWLPIRADVEGFARRVGRPIVLTEVGYPSLDGGAAWPWDETRQAPVDLEEQRRAYEAFARGWAGSPALQGVYFWNWFGFGGAEDTNYTPRGKPAADVLRSWFVNGRAAPPRTPR